MDLTQYALVGYPKRNKCPELCVTCKDAKKLAGKDHCQVCYDMHRAKRQARYERRRTTARRWQDKPGQCPRCTTPTNGGLCAAHQATLDELQRDPDSFDLPDEEPVVKAYRGYKRC